MNFETRNLHMSMARALHAQDGCQNTEGSTDLNDCGRKADYLALATHLLGYVMKDLITDVVIPIRKEERQRVAYRIRAELVCCDIHKRLEAEAAKGRWDDETCTYEMPKSWRDLKKSRDYHAICHFGGWAADIALAGPGRKYWCSSGGEFELNEGGGFQTCCDNPEGHIIMGPEDVDA